MIKKRHQRVKMIKDLMSEILPKHTLRSLAEVTITFNVELEGTDKPTPGQLWEAVADAVELIEFRWTEEALREALTMRKRVIFEKSERDAPHHQSQWSILVNRARAIGLRPSSAAGTVERGRLLELVGYARGGKVPTIFLIEWDEPDWDALELEYLYSY